MSTYKSSLSRKAFILINTVFLLTFSALCILPFINMLAISLSSRHAAGTGIVYFWPVEFTLKSYDYILHKVEFMNALGVSIVRVLLGTFVNVFFTIITAYPLSKDDKKFPLRTVFVWFFYFTSLFGGGLIPFYMVVKKTGLIDSIWSLIIPGAVPVGNVVLLLNFFRGISKELLESANIDGAGHWKVLWKIIVPISLPALATITLFTMVGHWNSWFDGLIFLNSPGKYPLSTYLQTILIQPNSTIMNAATLEMLRHISDRTVKTAQIFVGMLPILLVYPFLQKYFMTGLVLGSVKE